MRAAVPLLLAALALASVALPAAPTPSAPALDCAPACNVRVTVHTGPANEVMVAVDPTDPNRLAAVAKDYALGDLAPCSAHNVWMGLYTSRDGGRTWNDRLFPGHPGDDDAPLAQPLRLFDCSSDPVVAFDDRGRLLATGLGYAWDAGLGMTNNGLWVAQSLDLGDTWSAVGIAATGATEFALHDKQWIAVDPSQGAAYLAWSIGGAVVMSRSLGGIMWQPPVPVHAVGDADHNLVPELLGPYFGSGATPFVQASNHVVHLGLIAGRDIWIAHSLDHGGTWEGIVRAARVTPVSTPNTPYRTPTLPGFALDQSVPDGTIYTIYANQTSGSPEIVVARSRDNGHTYEGPFKVTDDPPGPNVQFFPAIAVGPDGAVHAAWYDRRNDPGNYLVDVYYSRSVDRGATWSPNLRVTTQSFDPGLSHHQHGFRFLGDYIGIAVGSDGVAHPVWADTRNGRADVYTARVLP